MHRTFDGTVYYLKPNRKIEFQNVTGQLARFKDLATSTPSFSKLNNDYTVTALGGTGTISNYSLVPKNTGSRVKSIGVTVGDASALIQHMQWNYTNGGALQLTDYYAEVGTFQLPMSPIFRALSGLQRRWHSFIQQLQAECYRVARGICVAQSVVIVRLMPELAPREARAATIRRSTLPAAANTAGKSTRMLGRGEPTS